MQSAMVLAVLLERNSSIAQLTKQQQQRPPDVLRRHVYAINSQSPLLVGPQEAKAWGFGSHEKTVHWL